ncbi:MAG: hypothetical protein ACTHJ1_06155 [Bordetella sp.]|uniref:hypothetical protein n=1 Tax=Bordetella sp. TaxID=28081 RepID=UPI003F7B4C39
MLGPKLRSARVDQYKPLGNGDRHLYEIAPQILAMIEKEAPGLSRCFAVPQVSADGSWIDWYAPEPGVVASWAELMASEQEEARARLVGIRHQIVKLQKSLQDSDDADARLCRDMLPWVFHHPDASNRFTVNDRPVLTFWGFAHRSARAGQDPLDFSVAYYADLAPSTARRVVPGASFEESVPWYRRWWVWTVLILVVLVSFFGFPNIPTDPNTDSKPAADSASPPLSSDYDQAQCRKNWGQCANRGWRGGSQ